MIVKKAPQNKWNNLKDKNLPYQTDILLLDKIDSIKQSMTCLT